PKPALSQIASKTELVELRGGARWIGCLLGLGNAEETPMNEERPELRKRPANFVPLTPISFLSRAATFFANQTAVIHGARRYTYAELFSRCRRFAHALTKAGVK